jgi:hypothetical protein
MVYHSTLSYQVDMVTVLLMTAGTVARMAVEGRVAHMAVVGKFARMAAVVAHMVVEGDS